MLGDLTGRLLKTTVVEIPPTHHRGSKAIYGVFATAGVECKAVEVLKQGSSVGDHLFSLPDICIHSILADSSPRVVPPPGRIPRADVHAYTSNHNDAL